MSSGSVEPGFNDDNSVRRPTGWSETVSPELSCASVIGLYNNKNINNKLIYIARDAGGNVIRSECTLQSKDERKK